MVFGTTPLGIKGLRDSAPIAASFAAVLLCALAAAELVLNLISPLESTAPGRVALAPARQPIAADFSKLSKVNPFDRSGPGEAGPIKEDLPVTTLRLVLHAATPTPGGLSQAIIETSSGKQQVFAEGDEIVRGVTLRRIETWRVVINRNGNLEALLLKNRPEVSDPLVAEGSTEVRVDVAAVPAADGQDASAGGGLSIASIAGPLLPMLIEQGFEANDVPLALDGAALPQEAAARSALLAQIQARGRVTITVARDGRRQDIPFTLPEGGNF